MPPHYLLRRSPNFGIRYMPAVPSQQIRCSPVIVTIAMPVLFPLSIGPRFANRVSRDKRTNFETVF